MNKDINYYMALPYKIEIWPEIEDEGYAATIPVLKGTAAFGDTREETLELLDEVKRNWLEIAIEKGWNIPEPEEENLEIREYSGRFNVRLPKYLHRRAVEWAEKEGTSLNKLVVSFISEGIGGLEALYAKDTDKNSWVYNYKVELEHQDDNSLIKVAETPLELVFESTQETDDSEE